MYKDKVMEQNQQMPAEEESGMESAIPETKYGQIGFEKAIKFLYGDKLKEVSKHLGDSSPEQLPKRLSDTVNVAIQKLEKEGGEPMPIELAAEVGFRLFDALQEDMVGDEIIPELSEQQVAQTVSMMLSDYAKAHPNVVSPDEFQQFLQQLQAEAGDPNQDPLGQAQMQQGQPEDMMAQEAMAAQPQQQGLLGV